MKQYNTDQCVCFKRPSEPFGDLSNMSVRYPLLINNISINSVEALYQLCRFPDRPDFQQELILCKSPMTVKMKSRKYKTYTRDDWEEVKVDVMWWCLRLKLAQHYERFSKILDSTEDKAIVEDSYRDRFWGAVRNKENPNIMIGENTLGLLFMKLRTFNRLRKDSIMYVPKVNVSNFKILGQDIEEEPETVLYFKTYHRRLACEFKLGDNLL